MSVSKFAWKRSFDSVSMPRRYSRIAMAVASRLADCCNARTGQCNPSLERLAKELNVTSRTVGTGIRQLVDNGWVIRKRGGRDETVNYTFAIPEDIASGMDDVTKVRRDAVTSRSYRKEMASIPEAQCFRSKEQGTRKHPSGLRPSGCSPARVDRVDVTAVKDETTLCIVDEVIPIDGGDEEIPF